MEWCAGQPFLASDYVCDFHEVVVDDVGQVVGGQSVGALEEHFVVEYRRVDGHHAADDVVDLHFATRLYLEPHHVLMAAGYELLYLLGTEGERVAHLCACRCVVLEVLGLLAFLVKFLGGVECYVGLSFAEQLVYILAIYVTSFALAVWAVVASEAHTFVELDAQPSETLYDIVFGSGHKACGVGVFDAENEVATVLACKQIVVEGGAYAAYMKWSGGTWCESHSYFTVGCHVCS